MRCPSPARLQPAASRLSSSCKGASDSAAPPALLPEGSARPAGCAPPVALAAPSAAPGLQGKPRIRRVQPWGSGEGGGWGWSGPAGGGGAWNRGRRSQSPLPRRPDACRGSTASRALGGAPPVIPPGKVGGAAPPALGRGWQGKGAGGGRRALGGSRAPPCGQKSSPTAHQAGGMAADQNERSLVFGESLGFRKDG